MTVTTCRDIVNGALRKIGVLGLGRSPSAEMATDAMDALVGMYGQWVMQGVLGQFYDTLLTTGTTYTAHEWERITVNDASTITITLPDSISDTDLFWEPWSGCYCNGFDYGFPYSSYPRPPRDMAGVIITDVNDVDFHVIYLYDAAASRWQELSMLTLNDNAPLALRFAEPLKVLLGEALMPTYGMEPSGSYAKKIAHANMALSHRYDSASRPAVGSYF